MKLRAKVEFINCGSKSNSFKYATSLELAKQLCEIQADEIEANPDNKITRVLVLNKKEIIWERNS